ncbi:TetR/AcrR family transcriptional regulator [Pseudomonas chlororaphis]|uniref:TetR/AcrR family transcriptional regulator n=1 Tax=Pseudomonas chlororaphis TaxID=587753 RepID=UPI002367B664|nr:TetR/AcrR family transcriptional regulator [Pseudomonas chlororaphis]WDH32430.1 TetR/AcrR family transcriptional regulator [Pseudomonas chlororaphis]WDH38514.1 TetR/AcrR family transcriptional regulator [Pseudomonas chlororaphis]
MARPLSEAKREALLVAASELIAQLGTGASTAKIAKAAGVSEGTLFTYFPSKDDLLNELFVEIEEGLAESILAPYPVNASARDRLFMVWSRLIDWGLKHSTERKALRQLKVSDRVTAESRKRCHTMFQESRAMVERCLAGHSAPERVAFYIDTILFDLADITMNAIAAKPKEREATRQAGFDLFWKGSAA